MTTKIGHFELVEQLGSGGYGTVWQANELELKRTVVIKISRKRDKFKAIRKELAQ